MYKSILFLCTGNTCRSPMAEFIARDLCKKSNIDISVESRGIYAINDSLMSNNSKQALWNLGIKDTDDFRSKPFVTEDINKFDIILTMTDGHKKAVKHTFNGDLHKIFTLYEFVYKKNKDIPDPFGQDYKAYEICALEIYDAVKDLIDMLDHSQ